MRLIYNTKLLSETLGYAWTLPAHSIRTPIYMVVKLSPLFREEHILDLRADFRTVPRKGREVY